MAAAAFVRRFQQRVFGVARLIVSDTNVAEEIAQEAFLRAWRSAATYDYRRGSVTNWLLTITRNLAIDALRARRARPVDGATAYSLAMIADVDPADTAADRVDAERARHALRVLPPEQARAVFHAAVLGRTAQEVSEIEGIPLGTAKTRIRTAMRRIRDSLADPEPELA